MEPGTRFACSHENERKEKQTLTELKIKHVEYAKCEPVELKIEHVKLEKTEPIQLIIHNEPKPDPSELVWIPFTVSYSD